MERCDATWPSVEYLCSIHPLFVLCCVVLCCVVLCCVVCLFDVSERSTLAAWQSALLMVLHLIAGSARSALRRSMSASSVIRRVWTIRVTNSHHRDEMRSSCTVTCPSDVSAFSVSAADVISVV
jgi:hypothetical protein